MKLLEDKGDRRAYCTAKKEIREHFEIPPLNLACAIGYGNAVRTVLAEADVDVNAKDATYGRTPLLWAVTMGHEAVVKLLLDNRDVDVNAKDTKEGLTSLSWALRMKDETLVNHLLYKGRADRDCEDGSGRRPLSFIIGDHQGKILTLLLEKGVEVNFTYELVSQSDYDKIYWYWC